MPPIPPAVKMVIAANVVQNLAEQLAGPKDIGPDRKPSDVRVEERVRDINPETLGERAQLLGQIELLQARGEAMTPDEREQLGGLVGRYKQLTITEAVSGRRQEVGVDVEKAPASHKLAGSIPVLGRVLEATGVVDTRPREVHHIEEVRPVLLDDGVIHQMESNSGEAGQKAAECLKEIRGTNDPDKLVSLFDELRVIQTAHNVDVLGEVGKGDVAKTFEPGVGGAGEASPMRRAIKGRMEEKAAVAEHEVVEKHDLGAATEVVREMSRETVSLEKAGEIVEKLKDDALVAHLRGDEKEASEKLAEMTIVASSMPDEVRQASKEMLVEVPKNPGEMLNAIENADKVDAMGALKVVGEMDSIAKEARERGIKADAADVFVEVMKIRSNFAESGREVSISGLLESDFEREAILKKLGDQAIMQAQSKQRAA